MFFYGASRWIPCFIESSTGCMRINTTIEHGRGYNLAMLPFEEVARQPVWSFFAFFLDKAFLQFLEQFHQGMFFYLFSVTSVLRNNQKIFSRSTGQFWQLFSNRVLITFNSRRNTFTFCFFHEQMALNKHWTLLMFVITTTDNHPPRSTLCFMK